MLRTLAERITPDDDPGDFAQAMMDLGATICTPRNPACLACPLTALCAARATGAPERYPRKAAKRARPERRGIAWWVEHDGAVWLVRRPERGLLGGMLGVPTGPWREGAPDAGEPLPGLWSPLPQRVRHVFTHFALELDILRLQASDRLPPGAIAKALGPGQWWPLDRLDEAGLPTLFARVADAATGSNQETGR